MEWPTRSLFSIGFFWICNLLRSTGGELTLQLKSQAESENPPK